MKHEEKREVSELVEKWAEIQKAWIENMNSVVEKSTAAGKSFFEPEQFQSFTESWIETQGDFLRKGLEMSRLFPTSELAERFTKAMEAQLQVFRWWADTAVKAAGGETKAVPANLMEAWRKSFSNIMDQTMAAPSAGPFQSWFSQAGGMPSGFKDLMDEWGKAWSGNMSKAWSAMAPGSEGNSQAQQFQELHDSWVKGYEETLGRWLNLPSIGPLRRNQELYQRALDSYVKLNAANFEYFSKLLEPSVEAFQELTNKTAEMMKGDMTPDVFRRLYQEMIKDAEQRFRALFETDEFVGSLQTTLDASLSFYRESQDVVEEYLKATPIITRTEMDEVHEEVYRLSRELDELKRKLQGKKKS